MGNSLSRRKRKSKNKRDTKQYSSELPPIAVTLGEPETVDSASWLTDMSGCFYNAYAEYWEPPIWRRGLYKIANANAYLGPILMARRNMIVQRFKPVPGVSQASMMAFLHNYLLFGDAAFLKVRDFIGRVVRLHPLSGMYLRRALDGGWRYLQRDAEPLVYAADDVVFLPQYDPQQELYGLPDYIGGVQSAMLNTDATLFRRKYYLNGAHCGYILFTTDPHLDPDKEDEITEAIKGSKGAGNFRSMFINIPGGDKDGVKIIPVGDISTKDEFLNVKSVSAQDMLTANRFPSGLAGIIPSNTGGLGDPTKYDEVYQRNEVIPVCKAVMDAINADPECARLGVGFELGMGGSAGSVTA